MASLLVSTLVYAGDSIDWKADVELLKLELPKRHFDFQKLNQSSNFEKQLDELAQNVDDLCDFECAVRLSQIVAQLGDSHTAVSIGKFVDRSQLLPMALYQFADGIYIVQTVDAYHDLLGSKLVAVNQIPIDVVCDSLSQLVTIENEASMKLKVPNLITSVQLLNYFHIAQSDEIELLLEREDGSHWSSTMKPAVMDRSNRLVVEPDSVALCYRNKRKLFAIEEMADDHLLYFQYNKCISREYPPSGYNGDLSGIPSFDEISNELLQKLKEDQFDKLVVDLRFNGGGSSVQGTVLAKELAAIEKICAKGKFYVIIGRNTFSSAILNALDFQRQDHAILVGEETSGAPNHFGEVRSFQLPSSGLSVNYSTKYFQRIKREVHTLIPDKKVETTFAEFKKGIDPVYEWIAKQ